MWNETIQEIVSKLVIVVASIYATLLFERFAMKIFSAWLKKQGQEEEIDQTVVSFVQIIFKVVLWVLVILFILQNMGLHISALLGGLGVAGLAVAFAFQKILEDVFSFFLIYFDKPFRVGDYIMVGADSGTVKAIGVRTTKLTTSEGQELLISNRELTNARLQNFKKMKQRRVVFTLKLTHETNTAQLKKTKVIITEIFEKMDEKMVKFNRVHLKEISETALVFEIVYTLLSKEYDDYMDVQERINLTLLEALHREKIQLASSPLTQVSK